MRENRTQGSVRGAVGQLAVLPRLLRRKMIKLTFNPPQILLNHIQKKQQQKDRVADLLIEISEVAEQLVDIWEHAFSNENDEIALPTEAINKLARKYPCNETVFFLLSHYYENISSVMGENYREEMEPLIFHISSLMNGRNVARNDLINKLSGKKSLIVFDKNNEKLDLGSIQDVVHAMRAEAAAFKVKTEVFKSKLV